jgi:hypothetical protein
MWILGHFYCRETSLGFNSVFQFLFIVQTAVLNPNRFFYLSALNWNYFPKLIKPPPGVVSAVWHLFKLATTKVFILECSICLEQFDCLEQFNDHPCCTSGNNLCSTDLMSPFWLQKSTWIVKRLLSCKCVWRKHETLKSIKNVTDCNAILKKNCILVHIYIALKYWSQPFLYICIKPSIYYKRQTNELVSNQFRTSF